MQSQAPKLVLASASAVRRRLLEAAGLQVETLPAAVDEAEVKLALKAENASAIQVAETLAELKARRVSERLGTAGSSGPFVIGADQMLECEGRWFDKPADLDAARAQLLALAGRHHTLETSVCVVRDGGRIWHHNARARLTLRPLSEAFIDRYLAAVGEAALTSVGAYQLEGPGIQLFQKVDGDFFTILGLPLLPLLTLLRSNGLIPQ
ncbi:Maf family protein [Algihabitans albus]|uniref:Maf family protein n=1 Tax=Algihabitans albus TaxID=2164067 RepID=UPI000E5D1798|nr:Maf family protein [Algihabitans albus]